ncbi:MAG: N,N-dimethylformamidase beta subunit family domain-containing protein [Chitinophagaceae bacterium]
MYHYVTLPRRAYIVFAALLCSCFSFATNPILTENGLPGNPASEWDISGAGDLSIQGFATDMSVNTGSTIDFKIDVQGPATSFTIKIYRLGYYNNDGARLIDNLGPFTGVAQPAPLYEVATGKTDCSNWAVSASWNTTGAVSGIYIAKLTRTDNNGSSHIAFVVRNDGAHSAILFKTSDATWQAYNGYGGNSLYVNNSGTGVPGFNHATKVSYNRPFYTRSGGGGSGSSEDWLFNAEYPMVRWMERNGYDVSYTTDVDMDRDPSAITPAIHKILLSVGHDEYWSAAARNKFETARNNGVHLAFFSGNEVYWKTRWEDNHRTLVCYKEGTMGENVCGGKCDPLPNVWTGLWRDGCAFPAADGCNPENALSGQISWKDATGSIQVPDTYKNIRFWRNTAVASLGSGQTVTLPDGTLGYEFDFEQYPSTSPHGRILLSNTTLSGKTHKLSLYRHSSGALVFGAGTVQWSWGLDDTHDRGNNAPSTDMQQATVNLFADMNVQPGSLQAGLVTATASTDNTAPVSVISTPANGAVVAGGSSVVIAGTASDANTIAGIEISIDGGTTWQVANGTSNWSYTFTAPTVAGSATIKCRAFDDSGNIEAVSGSGPNVITISITGRPSPNDGYDGPILVVHKHSNPFSRYAAEILRAQGFNEFKVEEIEDVNAVMLADYDVVVLGEMSLSSTKVTDLTNWVTNGGTLIAFRPDVQLSSLMGITNAGGNVSDKYLLVNTASAPGTGIVGETIQFHGTADQYNLNGATAIATLYSDATTATTYPAITINTVGANGGKAVAFTYDLAISIVLTRQGNPAWAGQNRDGQTGPERSDDMFFGNAPSDPQPDWVDMNKVAIPQADEQQQLLTNIIIQSNLHRKPLPRFWFLPSGKKAAVVMTGDDHASGGTIGRFNQYLSLSGAYNNPTDVADWKAVRGSSYIFPNTPISTTQAADFTAQGFEIGVHLNTGCTNWTPASLDNDFTTQLGQMASNFPGIPATNTHRTHCIAWSDWVTMAKKQVTNGIHLDVNYYYWPAAWVQDRPGVFTGSGMPMRFADLDGTMIDCYQVTTQLTDESGLNYSLHINSLLDKATGPEGYYGVFCANMHTDANGGNSTNGSDIIIAAAQAKNIPVVSARQLLTWLDGRNSSYFENIAFAADVLTFEIETNSGARNLKAMVPTHGNGASLLQSITHNSNAVAYTVETIKGIQYAFFDALAGNYAATYATDNTGPVITNIVATPGTGGTATITWTTDEVADSKVDHGTNAGNLNLTSTDGALVTNHTITLTGLSSGTTYHFRVTSADAAANSTTEPASPAAPLSFTMPVGPCAADIITADFAAGTTDANTVVITDEDGGVSLRPLVNEEFTASSVPSGWSDIIWDAQAGATTTYSGGQVTVNGTHLVYNTPLAPGTSVEFMATFTAGNFQNIGFAGDASFNNPWVVIGRGTAGDNDVYARTSSNQSVSLGSNLLNAPHRYRISWTAGSNAFLFYVDDVLINTTAITTTVAGNMVIQISDYPAGGVGLSVDWMRISPYATPGTFLSRVFDAGMPVNWGAVNWTADEPVFTSLAISVRKGNTPVPDGTWSSFIPVTNGGTVGCSSQYIQYKAVFATGNDTVSAVLKDISITCSNVPDAISPVISNVVVTPNGNGTALITWTTDEAATSLVNYGAVSNNLNLNSSDPAFVISHSITVSGLTPGTTYYYQVSSTDCSSNTATLSVANFFVPYPVTTCLNDQHTADFANGTTGTGTYISPKDGGEVILKPAIADDFPGAALPAGWQSFAWTGGTSTVSGGSVTVNGARLNTVSPNTPCAPGSMMEFVATFGAASFQHIGFGGGTDATASGGIYNGEEPWAMFSTNNTTNILHARVYNGSSSTNLNIAGSYIGSAHLYRINWNAGSFDFYIDGVLVANIPIVVGGQMRLAVSDYNNDGVPISVDWLQVTPYAASGTFTSGIYDAGTVKNWGAATWTADVPPGTTLVLSQRQSDSNVDILSEPWTVIPSNGAAVGGATQYIQYQAEFTTSNTTVTPVLKDFSISCSALAPISVSGNVWHDVNAMSDGYVNNSALLQFPLPPGIPVGLRVYLVNNATGLTEQVAFVNTMTGTYSFTDLAPNAIYSLVLSSSNGIVGNPPPALLLPGSWIHTGQKLGMLPGSDGLNDGKLIIQTGTQSIINANFGIKEGGGDRATG